MGELRLEPEADKSAFRPAVTGKGQEILIVEMHLQFIQKWFEGNRGEGAEKIGFATGFFSEFAEVVLRIIGQEKGAAAVTGTRRVDAPEIDVCPLSDRDGSVHITINWAEAGTEVINAG